MRSAAPAFLFVLAVAGCSGSGQHAGSPDAGHSNSDGGTVQLTISIAPTEATIETLAIQQFMATVSGSSDSAVEWAVQGADGGSVSATGLYTAPASSGTFEVIAAAHADPAVTAAARVEVVPATGPGPFQVLIGRTGGGVVSGSDINCGTQCSAVVAKGAVLTLHATADSVSRFVGWSGACSGTGPCTFTVRGNTSVAASFASCSRSHTWAHRFGGEREDSGAATAVDAQGNSFVAGWFRERRPRRWTDRVRGWQRCVGCAIRSLRHALLGGAPRWPRTGSGARAGASTGRRPSCGRSLRRCSDLRLHDAH